MIFLISGIPGAGKTTVSRALAMRFDRAVHLEGDLIGHAFIVSGLVPADGQPADEAQRQLDLRRENIRMLARSFCDAGFVTVIDDVVVSPKLLEYYEAIGPIRFVQLCPRPDVVEARDAARDKQFFHVFKHLEEQRSMWPEPRPGLWLDSSDLTVDGTVTAILSATS